MLNCIYGILTTLFLLASAFGLLFTPVIVFKWYPDVQQCIVSAEEQVYLEKTKIENNIRSRDNCIEKAEELALKYISIEKSNVIELTKLIMEKGDASLLKTCYPNIDLKTTSLLIDQYEYAVYYNESVKTSINAYNEAVRLYNIEVGCAFRSIFGKDKMKYITSDMDISEFIKTQL